MTNIILGVFHTEYFDEVQQQTESISYWDWDYIPYFKRNFTGMGIDVDYLEPLNEVVDSFQFLLDDLYLPLDDEYSVTCKELNFIINTPSALAKTEFWLKGEVVNKKAVLKAIEASVNQKLIFDNLDLNTFL